MYDRFSHFAMRRSGLTECTVAAHPLIVFLSTAVGDRGYGN